MADIEELRKISPFLVVDTDVMLFKDGKLTKTTMSSTLKDAADFRASLTDWENQNTTWTGTTKGPWTPVVDDVYTVIAYTRVENNNLVFIFWIVDINGGTLVRQIVDEKPIQSDPLGDALAATVLTLGTALVVRSLAAGLARVATAAVAAGARSLTLALTRIAAGESTESAILTALRSMRAQSIVRSLSAKGVKIVVNIGGEAGPEEVAAYGSDQIALNNQVRFSMVKRPVPNLVKEPGENIGDVFGQGSVDTIVSRKLDAGFDVNKVARGAFRVLKPGGTINMGVYSHNLQFGNQFVLALKNAGFKDVTSVGGALFRAVR